MLSAEADTRGDALRALVLCDAELASQRPDDALTGVLDPAAGTARHVLLAIAADSRTAPLRPLLVSGRGLRCAPQDADVLLEALAGRPPRSASRCPSGRPTSTACWSR